MMSIIVPITEFNEDGTFTTVGRVVVPVVGEIEEEECASLG